MLRLPANLKWSQHHDYLDFGQYMSTISSKALQLQHHFTRLRKKHWLSTSSIHLSLNHYHMADEIAAAFGNSSNDNISPMARHHNWNQTNSGGITKSQGLAGVPRE